MRRLRSVATAVLAATALASGCSSATTASIAGAVTYDGEPVGDGYITFTPADGKGQDAGGKIENGRYSVSGLPPGPKLVKVIATKKVNFASTSAEMQEKAAVARRGGNYDGLVDPADTIPDNAEGNNAKIDVVAGSQTCDFNLTKPVKKPR
jgi:hypothetical protein